MPVPGGIISRTAQLVRGLRNIDASGFEHIRVGNNPAEIVRVGFRRDAGQKFILTYNIQYLL